MDGLRNKLPVTSDWSSVFFFAETILSKAKWRTMFAATCGSRGRRRWRTMFAAASGSGRRRRWRTMFAAVSENCLVFERALVGRLPLHRLRRSPSPCQGRFRPWSVGRPDPGRRAVCRSVGRRPEVWPPYADPWSLVPGHQSPRMSIVNCPLSPVPPLMTYTHEIPGWQPNGLTTGEICFYTIF